MACRFHRQWVWPWQDEQGKKAGGQLQFSVGDHSSMDKERGKNLYESWSEVGGIGGGRAAETIMEETVGSAVNGVSSVYGFLYLVYGVYLQRGPR
jgi:hypothetical protein